MRVRHDVPALRSRPAGRDRQPVEPGSPTSPRAAESGQSAFEPAAARPLDLSGAAPITIGPSQDLPVGYRRNPDGTFTFDRALYRPPLGDQQTWATPEQMRSANQQHTIAPNGMSLPVSLMPRVAGREITLADWYNPANFEGGVLAWQTYEPPTTSGNALMAFIWARRSELVDARGGFGPNGEDWRGANAPAWYVPPERRSGAPAAETGPAAATTAASTARAAPSRPLQGVEDFLTRFRFGADMMTGDPLKDRARQTFNQLADRFGHNVAWAWALGNARQYLQYGGDTGFDEAMRKAGISNDDVKRITMTYSSQSKSKYFGPEFRWKSVMGLKNPLREPYMAIISDFRAFEAKQRGW